jgi:tetratricopeptide (TPR) repeat protein
MKAIKLYYYYSKKDEKSRNKLEQHLMVLQRQGFITEWHRCEITAEREEVHTIDPDLNTASLILLLISPSFMNSYHGYIIEMKHLMERHDTKEAHVIPILLKPVDLQLAAFKKLQFLPSNSKPVTAWRNQDEAFLDIAHGIRKIIEEWRSDTFNPAPFPGSILKIHTIDPPHLPKSSIPIWDIPFQRNLFFTGQEALLARLHKTLATNNDAALTQPVAITGLGGIGKTQVAIEYAHRYRDDYQSVLWIRADSHESFTQDFVALANLLQLPEKIAQDQNITIQAVKRWLKTQDRWLLILDNVENLAIASEFLPSTTRGHILLTTRLQAVGALAQKIELGQMGRNEGALFLLRRAKILAYDATLDQATEADRFAAEKIVEILGGLPLAIDQAGSYIEETMCTLSHYIDLYRKHHRELLRQRSRFNFDHPESVATIWSLAFEKIEQTNPAAVELLRFCAFLYPDAIPEEIITEGAAELGHVLQAAATDIFEFNSAIKELRKFSLLEREPDTLTFTIHRLVQAVLRDEMSEGEQYEWAERAVRAVNCVFPSPQNVANWPNCERYLLQAEVCADLIKQWEMTFPQAILLLNQTGYYLNERAHYTEAESLMEYALAIHERILGPNHSEIATNLNNLALLYDDEGKYEQAELLLQRALAIREKVLGSNHPKVATSLNNLATHYYNQGEYQQAEERYQQALAINERILGPKHPGVATNLNNLAELYRIQGKYEQAEPLYQRALAIREQALDPQHPDVAQSINNLAGLHIDQGKYEQAEPLYQRALAIFEQILGPYHPNVATGLNNLAELYRVQGKYEQAEPLYQRAIAILEQTLGPVHPNVAQSLNNLALLYRNQGKYEQAEPLYQRAIAILEQTLGPVHPNVAQSLNNLALLYRNQGKYEQAQLLMQRAIAIRQQTPSSSHTDITRNLDNLALLYKSQGKYEQAEIFYQRALAIREQKLGPHHPDVARSLNDLALLYKSQGKYEQAEIFYQRALAIREQKLGPHHPDVAQSLNNLAALSYQQGKYEQAELFYQRALSIFEQSLGHNHPMVSRILRNYAILLQKMKRDSEATTLQARAKSILAKNYS